MSALTKIFVVLVALLSVAYVGAMIPFVANTTNWKQKYEEMESARALAREAGRAKQQQLDEMRSARQAELDELSGQINALKEEIREHQTRHAAQAVTLRDRGFEIDKLRASDESLKSTIDIQTRTTHAQSRELTDRREKMRMQAVRMVEMEHRNNELQNDNDALTQQLRFFREENVELANVRERLEAKIDLIPNDVASRYWDASAEIEVDPSHNIEGRITGVRTLAGETFVEVNTGRTDGVLPGMRFFVQRGEQFVGVLVVTTVEPRRAAGRMKLIKTDVAEGDRISAGPSG